MVAGNKIYHLNLAFHSKQYLVILALTTIFFLILWAGVEARGFIFGPPIALAIGAKFVPLRKPNRLPGICQSVSDSHLVIINAFHCAKI